MDAYKLLCTVLLLLTCPETVLYGTAALEPFYTCTVQFPHNYEKKPTLIARFKGQRFLLENGSCQLPTGLVEDIFYLVITEAVHPYRSKQGSLKFKRTKNAPCKCYCIVRNSTAAFNKNQLPWIISELSASNQPETLPDNALIILLNPLYITDLVIPQEKCNQTKSIPTLVINPLIAEHALRESADHCALGSPDTNLFHSPLVMHRQTTDTHSIAIAKTASLT